MWLLKGERRTQPLAHLRSAQQHPPAAADGGALTLERPRLLSGAEPQEQGISRENTGTICAHARAELVSLGYCGAGHHEVSGA